MFTVIIAEQEHFEKFREYQLFIKPFMKKSQIAFCRWIPEEKTLKEALPDLEKTVGQQQEWRAVILCNEEGLTKQNPFDIVSYQEPTQEEKETIEDFYARRIAARKNAYDQAAKEPLVRLATWLCADPMIRKTESEEDPLKKDNPVPDSNENVAPDSKDKTVPDSKDKAVPDSRKSLREREREEYLEYLEVKEHQNKQEELEYQEYRQCMLYKQELRDKIRGDESIGFVLPSEIYCVAKRHCEDPELALNSAWSPQDEDHYSRFYDWNMYYDKMRYLVFDMADKQKSNYRSDYIRFIISVILLAGNEIPSDCLRPYRVYTLQCDLDEENLTQIMNRYDGKLEITEAELSSQVNEIRTREPERLSDEEVERIFCADVSIPVDFQEAGNQDDLYCREHFGLSGDCPVDNEETVWAGSYSKNKSAVKNLTRQSSRAVREAAEKFHTMNTVVDDRMSDLNEYQVEDVKEYVDREEKEMIDTNPNNVFDNQEFFGRMDKKQQGVLDVMKTRMRRNGTILAGVLCLVMVGLGLIPLFIVNQFKDFFDLPLPATVVLLILALVIVAAAALICLFFLRGKLKEQVNAYNDEMKSIVENIEDDTKEYSVYLSHACNVMRGNSVLSYHDSHDTNETQKVLVLQKHIQDLEAQQAELKDIFGQYLDPKLCRKAGEEEDPYDYDFSRTTEYSYPMPKAPDLGTKIEFLEPGNYVDIPYGIVKSMKLRREELYD